MDRDTPSYILKITKLDQEIRKFDTILVEIQEHLSSDDLDFYESIVNVRDTMYRLKEKMRNYVSMKFQSTTTTTPPPDDDDTDNEKKNTMMTTFDLTSWITIRDDDDEEDYDEEEEDDDDNDDNERRGSQLVR